MLADKKKEVSDRDLRSHRQRRNPTRSEHFKLELIQVSCGSNATPTSTVTLRILDGRDLTDVAIGTCPQ